MFLGTTLKSALAQTTKGNKDTNRSFRILLRVVVGPGDPFPKRVLDIFNFTKNMDKKPKNKNI